MKLLGVETSSLFFSVAAADGSNLLSYRQADSQGLSSLMLTDMIQEALKEAEWDLAGLEGFAISIGPGSFTGLWVRGGAGKAARLGPQEPGPAGLQPGGDRE